MTYLTSGASISKCGKYRYRLWREWGTWASDRKSCVFAMLNPSTADGQQDDPTIRRCVGFAKRWGYDKMEVVNLFAYRATDPRALLALGHDDDPGGIDNRYHVRSVLWDAGLLICAWGCHGTHLGQDETFLGWLPDHIKPMRLGLTKDGHPRHPLYLKSESEPIPYKPSTTGE